MTDAERASSPTQEVQLGDSRLLSFARYGAPEGHPVLYFHGWPGSHPEARIFDASARDRNLTILAVDRPGMGRSTRDPAKSLDTVAADLEDLLDQLELPQASLFAISGGGPFAMATAARLGTRISSLALVCPMVFLDLPGMSAALPRWMRALLPLTKTPGLVERVFGVAPWILRGGTESIVLRSGAAVFRRLTSPEDQKVLAQPEMLSSKADSGRVAFAQGGFGATQEATILKEAPSVCFAKIQARAKLWHGSDDRKTPVEFGRALAQAWEGLDFREVPGHGHSSIVSATQEEVLDFLAKGAGDGSSSKRSAS